MKIVYTFCMLLVLLTLRQPAYSQALSDPGTRLAEDSIVWQIAQQFTTQFNDRDTAAMRRLLPADFMLQWMHDNCMGVNALVRTMCNAPVHLNFRYTLVPGSQTTINYSDNHLSATINAPLKFLSSQMLSLMDREKGYGLCILYFQNARGYWVLKTVHIDVHCNLCNL